MSSVVWRGNPVDVAARVRAAEAAGTIVASELLGARPGEAMVRVWPAVGREPIRLTPHAPRSLRESRNIRRWQPWLIGVAVLLAAGVVVGLVLGVAWLVAWAVAHLAQIIGGLVVVALLVIAAGRAVGGDVIVKGRIIG